MKNSCNGCRVLRKGCDSSCSLRPCLVWMKNPQSQANATQFLAKFYGRSNFINFIDAAPQDQRPAIYKSLLYEACGRIVNPVYGSVGLLSSGKWKTCQMAVEDVLQGRSIDPNPKSTNTELHYVDIRHVHSQSRRRAPAAEKGQSSTTLQFDRENKTTVELDLSLRSAN